jgi:hypothetical protein
MKRAQREGLPFGAVLKLATKAFVDGTFGVGLISNEKFNDSTAKSIKMALKDIKNGKNLSLSFSSAKEAVAYPKS